LSSTDSAPESNGIIYPRLTCCMAALFRPPLLVLWAPFGVWACPIEVHLAKSAIPWPLAARGEVRVGGEAQNGDTSPTPAVCVATIAYTIPGPVSITTPRSSMAVIIAWRETAWCQSTKPTCRPTWTELCMPRVIITLMGWVHVREGAPCGDAVVGQPPTLHSFPQFVTHTMRECIF